jgi:carboxymethylenebutenolidase
VLRAVGMGPEPASAADAWRRIDAFLDAHLRGEERTGA